MDRIFILKITFILYLCLCVCARVPVPTETWDIGSLGIWNSRPLWTSQLGWWEENSKPLHKQQVLLTAEPSPQSFRGLYLSVSLIQPQAGRSVRHIHSFLGLSNWQPSSRDLRLRCAESVINELGVRQPVCSSPAILKSVLVELEIKGCGCGSVNGVPASHLGSPGLHPSTTVNQAQWYSAWEPGRRTWSSKSSPAVRWVWDPHGLHETLTNKDTNLPFSVSVFLTKKNVHFFITGVWSLSARGQRFTSYLGICRWWKLRGRVQWVIYNGGVTLQGILKGYRNLFLSFLHPGNEVSTFVPSGSSQMMYPALSQACNEIKLLL